MTNFLVLARPLLIFIDIFVITLLIAWFLMVPRGFDPVLAWISISIFYVYAGLFVITPSRVRWGLPLTLSIEVVFSLFYYILFYSPYQTDLLGGQNYEISSFVLNTFPEGANQALLMATVGFVLFHLGSIIPVREAMTGTDFWDERPGFYNIFDYGLTLILCGTIGFYKAAGFESSDTNHYGGSSKELALAPTAGNTAADALYLFIALFCVIALSRVVSTIAQKRSLQFQHLLMLLAVFAWSIYILILGDRNNFFLIAVAGIGGFAAFIRKVRWPLIIAMVAVALTLYQAIEIGRAMPEPSLDAFVAAWNDQGQGRDKNDSSFGNTTITLRATFEITPDHEPYRLGYFKLIGFGGIFPLIRGFLIQPGSGFTTSAEELTYYINGPKGWGIGSNVLSDIYLDFGLLGICIIMTGLGYFIARYRLRIIKRGLSSRRVFSYMILVGSFCELPRYSLDFPVRMFVWGFLIFFIYEQIFSRLSIVKGPAPGETHAVLAGRSNFANEEDRRDWSN